MFEAIGTGLTLWVRNIPLLSAIVLTIWLPANAVSSWLASQSQSELAVWPEFWLAMGIGTIFSPICTGAVIYALDRRWQAKPVGYVESMCVGIRCWWRFFTTSLVADILIGLSFFLFIIPAILLALRYSLIGMTVVLEERSGVSARLRSADLMRGKLWAVLLIVVVSYMLFVAVAGAFSFPLEWVRASTTMTDLQYYAASTVIDCVTDILSVSVSAVLFCIYVQSSGREKLPDFPDEPIDVTSRLLPLPEDDGNPYSPPRTS